MKDLSTVPHHPVIEELTNLLVHRTQNNDRAFFRVMVAYHVAFAASNMRVKVMTKDRGLVPVNLYTISLATSGSGKGHSVSILENEVLHGFNERFVAETFPRVAEQHLVKIAARRANYTGNSVDEELESLQTEFDGAGEFVMSFDSGTSAAIKQMRHKLLMADIGSINLTIDEIGNNLMGNKEILNLFLELYDQGYLKDKLTKNTQDNKRNSSMTGRSPANMLLFGTPTALLDGGKVEEEFFAMLETGYARRCLFAMGSLQRAAESASPAEIYAQLTQSIGSAEAVNWRTTFTELANPLKYGWKVDVPDDVGIELLTYKIECEAKSDAMPEHEEIRKAEMSHRYYKTLKMAGAFAFVDRTNVMTLDHLYQAMKLTEESGEAFNRIFERDKNYVRLAKFIAAVEGEVTFADMSEKLSFFKGSAAARNDMMQLAIAWGFRNNIVIKKTFMGTIECFTGETLQRTNLDSMILSYSSDIADNYISTRQPWAKLSRLFCMDGQHWINHHLIDGASKQGHRSEDNILTGFNMIVLDVENGCTVDQAQELLNQYTYAIYTTKRHTDENHRFRVVIPLQYELKLDVEDFKEFMQNVFQWVPFNGIDAQTGQRARKWASNSGNLYTNEGDLLCPLQFIPKTSKNEEFQKGISELGSMDNIERWFAARMQVGGRNNTLLRFAMMLVDGGLKYEEVTARVLAFNDKLSNKLDLAEIRNTVLVTVAKEIQKRTEA